ncbi:MAG: indolepyruvate ferredoxin oxidoreductase subunit alpha [Clostridiales bacterium]|nr:indolepyruvate ferredoxin oxidoreductase subunit alpha [Clostridiales bacterium]
MKKIMLGNEAVARGLYEAGCRLVSSYPGTPSTEITEYAAKYDEIYAEWAPNEKVALETAIGASVAGGRSACCMKHVGLNVAADPLFIGSYVGVGGGMLIIVADDPGMHSSQNEQDSRHYAEASKLPMLEPSNSKECIEFVKAGFELSEKFDTPVIIRLCTRISHSQGIVELSERAEHELVDYVKDPTKRVMTPANAKPRHIIVEQRLNNLSEFADNCDLNTIEMNGNKPDIGIITSGTSYNYAREVFGDSASYLKLGMVFPLPENKIKDFVSNCSRIIVIEELDDYIESFCKKIGIIVDGKNLLPKTDEFSQDLLREKLLGIKSESVSVDDKIPGRPPVLCPGCPHRGVFYVFKKLKLYVSGDIGCYTLGAAPPLSSIDTTFCMGASVSSIHGFNKIRPELTGKSVAVIGDSTFMHSGITGLVNLVYNKGQSTLVILDNRITAMTGHQENPSTGRTLKDESTYAVMPEDVALAVGVKKEHIRTVDPLDIAEFEKVLKEELASGEPSVIVCRRPCALLKGVERLPAYHVDADKCKSCRACMTIGCPCISMTDGKAKIDETLCTGCGLCIKLCRFGAINGGNK